MRRPITTMEPFQSATVDSLPLAALAAQASPKMSERYVYIDTREVVKLMAEEGWYVAAASAASPKKRDPLYAKHMIDFRHPDGETIHGMSPRIVFTNSHDGTSSASAMAGYFRFVCSNGLVIGTTTGRARARHIYRDAREFVHEMQRFAEVAREKREAIEHWNKIQLNQPQREDYARLVGQLRWGDAWAYEPIQLLSPRRAEDDDGSLLTTFNRAQENATRGGLAGVSRTGRRMISQPISGIERDLTFNAQLWQLTEEFAEAVAG